MIRAALTIAVASTIVAVTPSAPHAKGMLQANVVSMPSALAPGEPVPVVVELYVLDHAGTSLPVAGRISDVAVELVPLAVAGEAGTQHFPAEHLGDGRYGAEIVFPAAGRWALRVATGLEMPAIPLGKGHVDVPKPEASSEASAAIVPAAALLLALLAAAVALVGRRRRTAAGARATIEGRAPSTP